VLSAAQTGTHPGKRQTYGHSLVVNPWGEVLADGVVTEQEEAHLKNMQVKYGMSDEQVAAIAAQVRQ
jgi:predicted amidohydrolase